MLDFNKPVVTKKGKHVVVLTTSGPDKNFPVVGHLVGSTTMRSWSLEGVSKGSNRTFDLENATPCDPFTTEVTDGYGRVMLRLLVVPEDNKVVVEELDCVLEKDGRNLVGVQNLQTPAFSLPATEPLQQPTYRGEFIKENKRPAGGLATAFFNSISLKDGIVQE